MRGGGSWSQFRCRSGGGSICTLNHFKLITFNIRFLLRVREEGVGWGEGGVREEGVGWGEGGVREEGAGWEGGGVREEGAGWEGGGVREEGAGWEGGGVRELGEEEGE